jgi:hypothetical protein
MRSKKKWPRVIVTNGGEFHDLVFEWTTLDVRDSGRPTNISNCLFMGRIGWMRRWTMMVRRLMGAARRWLGVSYD